MSTSPINEAKGGKSELILGPQLTRMVKSGNNRSYQTLHSAVANYHPANANKGNLFEMDLVFLSFSVDKHFFPAAIYNPGQCQARFGGRSG